MIFSPKQLAYNELHFISTAYPRKKEDYATALDRLMDEVSNEIFELFLAEPVTTPEVIRMDCLVETE